MKAWRPNNSLPWRVNRGGSDSYVWFTVVDNHGDEIVTTGGVLPGEEADECLRLVAHLVTKANGSNEFFLNEEKVKMEWIGE